MKNFGDGAGANPKKKLRVDASILNGGKDGGKEGKAEQKGYNESQEVGEQDEPSWRWSRHMSQPWCRYRSRVRESAGS